MLVMLDCGGAVPPSRAVSRPEPRAFELEERRWESRPLLVFAPSAADARFAEVVNQVDAARSGMRERDMDDVRIVGAAGSVNGEPLARNAAETLRARFDVDADAFAVILVGKDGGVKLREDRPVPLATIFERIDAMPIRQAEMKRRE